MPSQLKEIKEFIKKNRKVLALMLSFRSMLRRILWPFPFFHKRYTTTKAFIGLDLTTECNLSCTNCEASCGQIEDIETMSIEQIKSFITESLDLGWKWERLTLRGGEPTLHPYFFEILDIVHHYKLKNPDCKIYVTSNASGEKVKTILKKLPNWIENDNLIFQETSSVKIFNSYNVAPNDLKTFRFADFTKGCMRTEFCNMALSRYGYYCCSPGANVDRIFGFDLGIKSLSDLDEKAFRQQKGKLCRYCGHFKEPNESILKEIVSSSWKKAYDEHNSKKPKLTLYPPQ